jgi:hypothetical protein
MLLLLLFLYYCEFNPLYNLSLIALICAAFYAADSTTYVKAFISAFYAAIISAFNTTIIPTFYAALHSADCTALQSAKGINTILFYS